MAVTSTEQLLLSTAEAAKLIGVGRSFFYSLISAGKIGPMPITLGNRHLWRTADLEQWVALGCPNREKWQQIHENRDQKNFVKIG